MASLPLDRNIVTVKGVKGKSYRFEKSSNGGIFQNTVYFSKNARLSLFQESEQPSLLFSETDWRKIKSPSVTHAGAFGSDYEKVKKQQLPKSLQFTNWVVVWKIPGDLAFVKGFKVLYNDLPVPVGKYPFINDNIWTPKEYIRDPKLKSLSEMPLNIEVTKYRINFKKGNSNHYLESDKRKKVAMMGHTYFIKNMWNPTKTEMINVSSLLNKLWSIGIYAFSCHGSHHAPVVFYKDLKTGKLITPKRLAVLLQKNKFLFPLIQKHATKDDSESWARNFLRKFLA